MDNALKQLPNGDQIYREYKADLAKCAKAGQKEYECTQAVGQKYSRKLPGMDGSVYPWSNYDWDYSTFIDNNYNAKETGATPDGTFGALFKNPWALMKIGKGFVLDPNPDSSSQSASSDLTECDPSQADYKGCQILNEIRRSEKNQKPPTNDPFFQKHSLDGKNSSSYYVRTGICPKMNTKEEDCKKNGWMWIGNDLFKTTKKSIIPSDFLPGMCFKPRYGFVRNQPGFKIDISLIKTMNNSAAKVASGITSAFSQSKGQQKMGQAAIEVNRKMANQVANMNQATLNALLSMYEGAVPSALGDVLDMSPIALYEILKGQSTANFVQMDCDDNVLEGFCPPDPEAKKRRKWTIILVCLLFFILCMVTITYWNVGDRMKSD